MPAAVSVLEKPESSRVREIGSIWLSEPKTSLAGKAAANRKKPWAGPGHPAADGVR